MVGCHQSAPRWYTSSRRGGTGTRVSQRPSRAPHNRKPIFGRTVAGAARATSCPIVARSRRSFARKRRITAPDVRTVGELTWVNGLPARTSCCWVTSARCARYIRQRLRRDRGRAADMSDGCVELDTAIGSAVLVERKNMACDLGVSPGSTSRERSDRVRVSGAARTAHWRRWPGNRCVRDR